MRETSVEVIEVQCAYEDAKYREHQSLEQQLGPNWKKRIFEIVLTNACSSVETQGLRGTQSRSFNRILDALDTTTNGAIRLSRADAEFLKQMLLHDQVKIGPLQVRIFCLMQEAIEQAFKHPEVKEE